MEGAFVAKRSPLAERLDDIQTRIASACAKAKRDPAEVSLVAVTKTAGPEQIREILSLGVSDLGESRAPALAQRAGQITEFLQRRTTHGDGTPNPKVRWHMLGHLQRNKVKPIIPYVNLVHSVDSLRLAEEIDQQAQKIGRKISVLLQVNTSEETQKFGVAVGAAVHLAEQIDSMPNVQLIGLMAMGPLEAPEAEVRHVFARTREIFEELKWHKIGKGNFKHLSMGMSTDFELGVLEGSTMVRIGTALFGGKPAETEEQEEG